MSAFKNASSRWMSCMNPSMPGSATPYVNSTSETQFGSTDPTTTLKIVGERGSSCVTPIWPLKGPLKYPPAIDTIVRRH